MALNSDVIMTEHGWSPVSLSLNQSEELVPFKLLRLTSVIFFFFSFEKRSDKKGRGPLNHGLRAPSQRIHRLERLHHYSNRKQKGADLQSGAWDHSSAAA